MVAEDVGAKRKIEQLLSDREETLQEVKNTIQGTYFFSFFSLRSFIYFFFYKKKDSLLVQKKISILFCFGVFFSLSSSFSPKVIGYGRG